MNDDVIDRLNRAKLTAETDQGTSEWARGRHVARMDAIDAAIAEITRLRSLSRG